MRCVIPQIGEGFCEIWTILSILLVDNANIFVLQAMGAGWYSIRVYIGRGFISYGVALPSIPFQEESLMETALFAHTLLLDC